MRRLLAVGLLSLAVAACSATNEASPQKPSTATSDSPEAAQVGAIAARALGEYDLAALIVQVTRDGQEIYKGAVGESMSGVPATPDMHFRNGAFAFTYIGQTFMKLVDEQKVSLDDPLATWLPDLPEADKVTVKNLLNMTSGYPDYVRMPKFQRAFYRDPFRQWTNQQLMEIGLSEPLYFEPGTNWAYSHTNYVVLGEVLAELTGRPTAEVLQQYVLDPMDLTSTSGNDGTPAIPEPVLHSFTSERRGVLDVDSESPFTEESTFWNPSWTTAEGAVQTSTIDDVTRSMEIVGSGTQVSPQMHQEQVGKNLAGFGEKTADCPLCQANTEAGSYGLGVVLLGDWITQTKYFAGSGATSGYLPDQKLTISVVANSAPSAFDVEGESQNPSVAIFTDVVSAIAPDALPPKRSP